ncbi:MAG: metalloregulator ArsR/SmtB family transcription factor [Desulfobacterales bacterium]|jgi:DNA-binding transcriptional ArsR family regulator|nr:metalloregulator ArsR/SmtB family transcription factor [Desulfobacterales bacterium]
MSNIQNINIDKFADIFKALSNPNRLQIFLRLVSCCAPGTICSVDSEGGAFVGDLSKDLDIVPSTVSHHIKELRQAGLIKMKRKGQKIECWVEPEVLDNLSKFFSC